MASMNQDRTFGVEIECYVDREALVRELAERGITARYEGYHHRNEGRWKIVYDGSLGRGLGVTGGYELVSPPLRGEAGLEELERACAALQAAGARVNVKCGLHVHHDARTLRIQHFRNLVKLYAKYEAAIDQIMPRSRRAMNSQWARSLHSAASNLPALWNKIDACETLDELRRRVFLGCRYWKLNLQSYVVHGTVEFRHHSGTVEFEKIASWVQLTSRLMDRAEGARTIFIQGEGKFDNVMRICGLRPVVKFYRQRRQALAA